MTELERVTASEFARRERCDVRQVRRALARGTLVRGSDGLLDVEQIGSSWRRPNRRTLAKSAGASASTKVADPPPLANETPREAARRMVECSPDLLSLADALRVKENYLAKLRQLEFEQREGQLIELAIAEAVVFDLCREQRDAWLRWPTKVAPFIAAALRVDVDCVTALLREYVHNQLTELGEPQPDFSGG